MFITFEGIEGSGKSSCLHYVAEALRADGWDILETREPGGSTLGLALRAMLLDTNTRLAPSAELFLYLADRAQHVHEVVRPALKAGTVVFCDRYADSTVVYQGYGRGMDPDALFELNEQAVFGLWPDLTLLFDLDPEIGLARAHARDLTEGKTLTEGRFEAECLPFHVRVRNGYLDWAERFKERYRIVDASQSIENVFESVMRHILRASAFRGGNLDEPGWRPEE